MMKVEFWDLKISQYVKEKVTEDMFWHALNEMAQRFKFAKGGEDALHQYVNDNPAVIHCDRCDTPKENVAYKSYLVPKMLNMSILDQWHRKSFTKTEMCLWWVLWKNTKDIEINGVPVDKFLNNPIISKEFYGSKV
tara:strand:- start:481 stop:888 length:408 start_codon:yes stop_codon:yes gene_type:complete